MTDDEINIAIAEACGWTQIHVKDFSEMGVPCFMTMGLPQKFTHIENALVLPDYCTDLNAMHDAEKTLKAADSHEYANMLYDIACKNQEQNGKWLPYSISARQRAEAFLRTLGKWKEVLA